MCGGLFVLWLLALRAPAVRKVPMKNDAILRSLKAHFRSQEECLLTAAELLHASRVGLLLAPDAISRKSLRPPVGDALVPPLPSGSRPNPRLNRTGNGCFRTVVHW